MEPARILRLLLCVVENATSMTKKLIIRPMRSAKDTYQPCPPPCAAPRFFLAIAYFPGPPLHADQAGTGSPSSWRCFFGKYASNIFRTNGRLFEFRILI